MLLRVYQTTIQRLTHISERHRTETLHTILISNEKWMFGVIFGNKKKDFWRCKGCRWFGACQACTIIRETLHHVTKSVKGMLW